MNSRNVSSAFFLAWFGAGAVILHAALTEGLEQLIGPFAWEPDCIRAFWLLCVAAGALAAGGIQAKKKSPLVSGLAWCLLFGAGAALAAWGLSWPRLILSHPAGGFFTAAIMAAATAAPLFFLAGVLLGLLCMGEKHPFPKKQAFILAGAALGGALGAFYAPYLVYEFWGLIHSVEAFGCVCAFSGMAALMVQGPRHLSGAGEPGEKCPGMGESLACFCMLGIGAVLCVCVLVWTRALIPLLGDHLPALWHLPLAVMAGIGAGAALFLWKPDNIPVRVSGAAGALCLTGLCVAAPRAAGDHLALFAALLRPIGSFGPWGSHVFWGVMAFILAFPASLVLGYCLSGLMTAGGKGGLSRGRGLFFLFVGFAAGLTVFRFVIPPFLGTMGAWRLAAAAPCAIGIALLLLPPRTETPWPGLLAAAAALALVLPPGPGALWKHGGIGAGRLETAGLSRNELREFINGVHQGLIWEGEERNGIWALDNRKGPSLIVNGRTCGEGRLEEFAQSMVGLLGAVLHGKPGNALVLGMGDGCCARMLAQAPSIRTVQVAEPSVHGRALAKRFSMVNGNVLGNPKVSTSSMGYVQALERQTIPLDMIISMPTDPSLTWMTPLYTQEFFRMASRRLAPGGLFLQYLRSSLLDAKTMNTLYATLCSVFGSVETWQVGVDQLVLICRNDQTPWDLGAISAGIAREPFREYLAKAWGVADVEGVLSRFVCGDALARKVGQWSASLQWINVSDRPLLRSSFSSAWARPPGFCLEDIRLAAWSLGLNRPVLGAGLPDWRQVDVGVIIMHFMFGFHVPPPEKLPQELENLAASYRTLQEQRLTLFENLPQMASGAVPLQHREAGEQFRKVLSLWPVVGGIAQAQSLWKSERFSEAVQALSGPLEQVRQDPWLSPFLIIHLLKLSGEIATGDVSAAGQLRPLLTSPFCNDAFAEERKKVLFTAAWEESPEKGAEVIHMNEPFPWWDRIQLDARAECYRLAEDPLMEKAERDVAAFNRWDP